jgi:aspartyl protease family protein
MILIGGAIGCLMPIGRQAAPAAEAAGNPPPEKPHETKLTRWSNGHFYTDAYVNKKTIHFVVDTGATDVALTEADARMAGV